MTHTQVTNGDISQVKADALITAINSGGMWFGGIDGVIQRSAGSMFHQQAQNALPLQHGQTVVAKGDAQHDGAFKNVVFVIDDLEGRLADVVYNGLKAASDAGFTSVTLPTIRMGVMLGAVEKSVDEAVDEMAEGVRRFKADYTDSALSDIKFVVYGDESVENKLREMLADH
jgi:O-acetyl-ADP-ribose deacetylase (regulator of RNase III)